MDSPQHQQQQPHRQPQQQHQQQILGHVEPQRLFKAKVQVIGRFLLRPEEDFGPEKADELVRRAAKDGTKVRTTLLLFTNGVRLGESGIFASMPLEFTKYQRIAACISPRQQQQPKQQQQHQQQHQVQLSRLMTLCTRDYEQKCVTVLQFKDATALAEASRLIDRQRRLVAEEADYLMMDVKPQSNSNASNWALETAPQQQQQPQHHQRRPDSLASSLTGFGPFDRRPAPFLVEPAVESAASRLHHHQQPIEARVSVRRAASSITDDVFYDATDRSVSPRRQVEENGGGGGRIDSVIVDYNDVSRNGGSGGGAGVTASSGFVVSAHSSGSSRQHQQQLHHLQQLHGSASMRERGDYVDSGRSQQVQQQHQVQQMQYSVPTVNQQQQQQMQLMKLVPVRRRQHHYYHHHQPQQQPQFYAVHPSSALPASSSRSSLGRGLYLVSK